MKILGVIMGFLIVLGLGYNAYLISENGLIKVDQDLLFSIVAEKVNQNIEENREYYFSADAIYRRIDDYCADQQIKAIKRSIELYYEAYNEYLEDPNSYIHDENKAKLYLLEATRLFNSLPRSRQNSIPSIKAFLTNEKLE